MHIAYIKNSKGVNRSSDTSKNGFLAITLQTYESQVGNNTTNLCNIFNCRFVQGLQGRLGHVHSVYGINLGFVRELYFIYETIGFAYQYI